MIVCATGHRIDKFAWFNRYKTTSANELSKECIWIKNMIQIEVLNLIENGYDHFISGMAIGFDTWFAECVIEYKQKGYNIKLEAAIPCYDQESLWPQDAQDRYFKILSQCDIKTIVCKDKYKPYYMIRRNEYMIDKADIVLACYNGTPGGTRRAYSYALDKGRIIINIEPNKMIVRKVKL